HHITFHQRARRAMPGSLTKTASCCASRLTASFPAVDHGLDLLREIGHFAWSLILFSLTFGTMTIGCGRHRRGPRHGVSKQTQCVRKDLIGVNGIVVRVGWRWDEMPLMHGLQRELFELLALGNIGQCPTPHALVGNTAVAMYLEGDGDAAFHARLRYINREFWIVPRDEFPPLLQFRSRNHANLFISSLQLVAEKKHRNRGQYGRSNRLVRHFVPLRAIYKSRKLSAIPSAPTCSSFKVFVPPPRPVWSPWVSSTRSPSASTPCENSSCTAARATCAGSPSVRSNATGVTSRSSSMRRRAAALRESA